jgi:hypothetical protein
MNNWLKKFHIWSLQWANTKWERGHCLYAPLLMHLFYRHIYKPGNKILFTGFNNNKIRSGS